MANKQIKDFDLKESIDGEEDLLIQDSDGVTKRIKTSKLMDNLDLSIPTKTSELTNDSGFLTSHQDVSGKADKTYVDAELAKKANKSHTHSYNNLTDKPSIPSIDGLATKKELTDGLATKSDKVHTHDQYLTEHQDISMKANKTELHSHSNKTVLDGITSTKVNEWDNKSTFDGNYNSLTNKPTIPTVDVNKSYVDAQLANKSDKTHNHDKVYALKTDIPTSLPANGGNADTVNNIHIVVLTQEDYDGLEVKDETTLYIIKG